MTGGAYTYASELTEVGLGLELATAVGVAVAPTVQLVIDKAPDSADNIGAIEDKGMRGTMADVWDIIQGTAHATVGLSGAHSSATDARLAVSSQREGIPSAVPPSPVGA